MSAEFVGYPCKGGPAADFEEFSYVAAEAFEFRTGQDSDEFYDLLDKRTKRVDPVELEAEPDTSDEFLARRFPNIWARFGETKREHDAAYQTVKANGSIEIDLPEDVEMSVEAFGIFSYWQQYSPSDAGCWRDHTQLKMHMGGMADMSHTLRARFPDGEGIFLLSTDFFDPDN